MTPSTRRLVRSSRPGLRLGGWGPAPLVLAVCAGLAAGQAAEGDGAGRAGRIEEAERVLPRVAGEERAVRPTRTRTTRPVSPGLTRGEDWSEGAGVRAASLPEGSFLIERPGRVIAGPHGRRVFVPTGEERSPGEGPMLLLPCAALERLEATLAGGDGPVRVSGEVFVYRDRRHLLVTSFLTGDGAPAEADATPADAAATDAGTGEETAEPESLLDDPEVRGLLEELESEGAGAGESPAGGAASGDGGGDKAAPAAPDGTPVVRRRGRLVRVNDGAWSFVFDNDEPDALASRSLAVLPCLLLQRIEREALILGDAHEVALSGRVYIYGGQAFLLPTMMVRVAESELSPTQ